MHIVHGFLHQGDNFLENIINHTNPKQIRKIIKDSTRELAYNGY